jgi:hypothetical protein
MFGVNILFFVFKNLYLGVLRIVIKNNIIIDLRTKILFGRCFPSYLEYCFHVLFYYYYLFIY